MRNVALPVLVVVAHDDVASDFGRCRQALTIDRAHFGNRRSREDSSQRHDAER
jgi:hypothetical protein